MSKKDQNIMIYLRKDTYEEYKKLSILTKQPISRIIAQTLNEPSSVEMIKSLCKFFEEIQKGGEEVGKI